jgi:hypothetical protein
MADYFKSSGCESFSVMNEWRNTIVWNIGGTQAPNDLDIGTNYVQSQKDTVQYVKTSVPTGYPDGYTVSDLFYKTGDWISSNSLAPLDYLGYTSYDTEPNAFDTMKKAADKFGGNKIQLDEMSLSGTWRESIEAHLTADSNADYNYLLQRRVKYALELGIRRIFRFEFIEAGESNGTKWGFGYMRNGSAYNFGTWLNETQVKCVIDPVSTFKAANFRKDGKNIEFPATPVLNNFPTNQLKIEAWVKRSGDTFGNQTIVKKDSSYIVRYEGNDLRLIYWKGGVNNAISYNTQPSGTPHHFNKWRHIAATVDTNGAKLYIDGVEVASSTVAGNLDSNTNILQIGGAGGAGETLSGMMDQLKITNNVTPIVVSKEFVSDANTTLLIKFEQPLVDLSSNAQSGTYSTYNTEPVALVPSMRDTIKFQQPKFAIKAANGKKYKIKNLSKKYALLEDCNEFIN